MNWDTYKALADSPNFFTRWMLEQTAALADHPQWLRPDQPLEPNSQTCPLPAGCTHAQRCFVVDELEAALLGSTVPKPAGHKGGLATDLIELSLSDQVAHCLVMLVQGAIAANLRTPATQSRGLGGFAEAWQEYLASFTLEDSYPTHSLGAIMSQASQPVLDLINGFNQMDMDAIASCFSEDAVYHNMPMDPVTGRDNIRASLEPFIAGATQVQWDLLSIAENAEGHVLTERVDRFEIGGTWIAVEVMGICEVAGGKITAWRDYFDLAQFQQQMASASA